jgi:hypothetical protein
MSNVETNSCGRHISFAFPRSGTHHDVTRDRLDLFLSSIRKNTTIKALSLVTEEHAQTDDDFSGMWDAIGEAFGAMSNLQEVTFQRTNSWDTDAVSRILANMTNVMKVNIVFYSFVGGQMLLQRLDLRRTRQLCNALSKCIRLQEAHLISVASESTNEFFVGLSKLPNLRHLVFSCHPFNETTSVQSEALRPFFHSETLQSLNLAHLNLDRSNCAELAAAIQTGSSPASLRVEECLFHDPNAVWSALKSNRGVRELRLEYTDMHDEMIDGLIHYLGSGNQTLQELNLVLPRPRETITHARVGRLFSFLAENNNCLKYLSFHSLPMNAEDLASLGTALAENPSLEKLDLHGDVSQLKSDDLIAFASRLSINRHLKCFDLSGSPVLPLDVEKDGERFLEEMRNNVTLKKFNMTMPSSSLREHQPRWFAELQSLLQLNAAGRRYMVDDANNLYQCTEVLGAVRHDLNCLYLHLRENPGLCKEFCSSGAKKQRIK